MTFKKAACGLLLVTLAMPATLVRAADEEMNTNMQARPAGIRGSIDRAAASVAAQPSASNSIPLSLPRRAKVSKGMGAGMMVMSLVGTAAGLAGTYYMIKTMKDQTKTTPGS
jgi:hypothetical protein